MPKYEILHSAGSAVPSELGALLAHYFPKPEIDKLEQLGGRVVISITAPYRRKSDGSDLSIDSTFLKRLADLRGHPRDLKAELAELSAKQLRELARLMHHPVRSGANRQQMIEELFHYFRDESIWRAIVDKKPQD